ncbi:hypothetical protein WR25_11477 [Diploscapter pachys]|uniref:Glucosyltransferase 24 catalytic domain-containing protein n=1 Tax=Diploscapter pachys TaxID=2018661 RepID=A0A2A2J638_9BILA|nr:hypothetical protein WR25_11477 [Diploscapter pachys]
MEKTALGKAPKVLLNGYVLDDSGIKSDKIEETIMYEVMKISPTIQRAVMEGRLKDRSNVANWLMEQKDVMPRLNARVLDAPTTKNYLDLTASTPCKASTLTQFGTLTAPQKSQCILEWAKYLQKSEEDITAASTLWVAGDAETAEGRDLFYSALKNLKHSKSTRVTFVMNPADEAQACKPNSITNLIHAAFRLLPRNQAKQFVTKLVKEENVKSFEESKLNIEDLAVGGMNVERFNKEKKQLNCDRIKMEAKFAQDILKLKPSERAIVANGLIVGPLSAEERFIETDFALLDKMLEARGAAQVATHVDKWEIEKNEEKASDMVLRSMALVGKHAVSKKRTWIDLQGDGHSVVKIFADDASKAIIDVATVVDPLSTAAQKVAPILELIGQTVNCDLRIVMNPKGKLSELPLKRFYRYVASPQLQFDQTGSVVASSARFSNLPSKQLLTLSVHAPDAWMIEAVYAEYDLDNIKMQQANPGSWLLRLREGKSKEIYKISNHFNSERTEGEAIRVLIDSFSGRTIRVRVVKNEGMEERSLLSDENEEGIWNSISQTLTREKPEKINVFSLASGHLYERFMRIMILSVMKKTKSPVKFWLLKNYLSPQFKKTLPLMAKEYGFEYALVEYKWPRWLHQQKEKHRVMWGYKILFLDVLFPLDVQKIIFVDADQVVRADLMELMELDLGGAPYGQAAIYFVNFKNSYVPFCESRKEMDGFRFWKQGYWANHLAGRRYHISALYVIDLHKFRQIAAGDRLRGQYQGLSSDPNSLSNLDQDLPNNMIHQVKIKSLPQEWLWCETWCDDTSKSSAKTIDLCNNPMTKEPKLDSAIRIIPEWREYDEEIKKVIASQLSSSEKKQSQEQGHPEL